MFGIDIQSALPWGWGLGAFVAAIASLGLYGLWIRALPRVYRGWILTLRALFLMVVLLLLLDPRIKWSRDIIVPPRIGIFLDNSLSMANHPTASATTVYSQVANLVEWVNDHNYEPVIMTFGEKLINRTALDFDYQPDERLTDFNLLEEPWQTGGLQAGFMFSDGVATSGMDPSAISVPPEVPIYTIGIGDTASGVDLSIIDLRYPLSLLAQEQGNIQVTIRARNASGERGRLYIFHEDELIHSQPVSFTSPEHVQQLEVTIVGRLDAPHFRVEFSVLPDEANIDNNRREFQIDVLPGRRQITLITGALSPNTSLIGRRLKQTEHAQVDHLLFLRGRWQGDASNFWATSQDLVVLDNYPTTALPEGELDRLMTKLRRDKTQVLVIEGPNNLNREFVRMMRTLGLAVEVTGDTLGSLQRIRPVAQAALPGLPTGLVSGLIAADFPPISVVHTLDPLANSSATAVLVGEGDRLVLGYSAVGGLKRAVMLLPALASVSLKLNRTGWGDFLVEIMDALVEWELEPQGFTPYVIQSDRRAYHLGEKVRIRGLMRDRTGTKMLQPTLTLEVRGPENTATVTLTYNFDSGEYEGDYWPSEAGAHYYTVYDREGAYDQPTRNGFQVQAGRVELESLAQNRYGLQRLAQSTGGRYVDLAGVDQLVSDMAYVAKTVTRDYHFSLWQIRYLWVGLLLLLGLEWGIRRIAGLI
ncbi:MAG: hypothetical protein IID14_00105 [Candidatus Marinimicrobia bacterium]|nr:hypothetical protein [Candidatus Neomarinimicrobiota bacterium]